MGQIHFPDLGIVLDPDPIAFSLLGKDVYWYGIIIALGFLLAVIYGLRRSASFGLTEDNILDMLFVAVPSAIVCARAYYCLFNWEAYAEDPISVLYIWEGGIAIYGGVIGAVVSVFILSKIKKIPFGAYGDVGAIGLLIGQMVGRWGNFINREAHGSLYDGFLRMGIEQKNGDILFYHPTFLYESRWNFVGAILLHFYSKKRKFDGEVFCFYVLWYGLGRAWIEGLRTDSLYLFSTGIRVSQLLAVLSAAAALVVVIYYRKIRKRDGSSLFVDRKEAVRDEMDEEVPYGDT